MYTQNKIIYNVTENLLSDCKENSIDIRLFGSVALLYLDKTKIDIISKYHGIIGDIDIIIKHEHLTKLEDYCIKQGYTTNRKIKMLYGNKRRSFYLDNNISIDVFIGDITLCQKIPILNRFNLSYPTITPVDLFLTKIQKLYLSDSDVYDITFILEHIINFQYIIDLSSKNWNWWKVLTKNIDFILKKDINENNNKCLKELLYKLNLCDKTINWKIRNIIGERKQWYNDVE